MSVRPPFDLAPRATLSRLRAAHDLAAPASTLLLVSLALLVVMAVLRVG